MQNRLLYAPVAQRLGKINQVQEPAEPSTGIGYGFNYRLPVRCKIISNS